MKPSPWIRILFALAAAYDGVLGIAFLLAPSYPYSLCGVTPPNHWGYVQFPAALRTSRRGRRWRKTPVSTATATTARATRTTRPSTAGRSTSSSRP